MKNTIDLLFYDKFILLKDMRTRLKTSLVKINCIGVKDGEQLNLYVNGKNASTLIVADGSITICIEQNKQYRLASQSYPYGVKFTTIPANDDTEDTLIFPHYNADPGEIKNIYRALENLCSKIQEHEEKIAELSGYQTE